jgi:hypothetical protein
VYVVRWLIEGTTRLRNAELRIEGSRSGDWAGVVVVGVGDLTGGVGPDLAFGAVGAACRESSEPCGAVYLFDGRRSGVVRAPRRER